MTTINNPNHRSREFSHLTGISFLRRMDRPWFYSSRQASNHTATIHKMKTNRNPVGWFEIYVQDMERAKAFYQNTFQVTLERLESPIIEMWAFSMQSEYPGCPGSLVRMEGKDSGGGGTIIYFSCVDCAAEASRAVQNGGQIQKGKMSIGQYGFIAIIFDTEGNMIGLHSMQ